jgi:hypothetical protein
MAESKYGKYLCTDFVMDAAGPLKEMGKKRLIFNGAEHWGINYWMRWTYITKPFTMEEKPHSHDYDQCAHFYGGDPSNVEEFDAEVEFYLGEEGEKQVITRPTIVFVPKGLIHCPLVYKRIGKPIIFQNVCFTGEYEKTMDTGEKLKMPKGV